MYAEKAFIAIMLFMLPVAWCWAADNLPDVPVPDDMSVTEVAEHIVFNGLDMNAKVFKSSMDSNAIVDFYRDKWGRRVVINSLGESKIIGHREGDYYITVQVSGYAGGSRGKIGIIDLATAPDHFVPGKGLPAPMGAKVFNDIRYPDDPVPARTVAMRDDLSPRQNVSYFNERLLGQGWKPAAGNQCRTGDSCVLRFTRGDSKMTLMVMRAKSGSGQSQVVINVQNPEVGP